MDRWSGGSVKRKKDYEHPNICRRLCKVSAAGSTVGRAEILVEELEEDELAPPSKSWSKRKVFSKKPTVLPVRGGEWIVDSGSSFHIVSPADMTTAENGGSIHSVTRCR